MELRFTKILPYLLCYTDRLPSGFKGAANGPFVRIKKSSKNDFGLHVHEETHVRQFYMTLSLHSYLYLLYKPYRQWAEVKAFHAQYKTGADLNHLSHFLASNYGLKISVNEAKKLILKG